MQLQLVAEEDAKAKLRNESLLKEIEDAQVRLRDRFNLGAVHHDALEQAKVGALESSEICFHDVDLVFQMKYYRYIVSQYPAWSAQRVKKHESRIKQWDLQLTDIERRRIKTEKAFQEEMSLREERSKKVIFVASCN